ncbi:hypothetical protein WDA45_13175 [Acinetobacter pittii]|uniref:hypothetical protein n=1 Tax=Acinetobacter pittii TaxID=48296 RepID=UPI00374E6AE5
MFKVGDWVGIKDSSTNWIDKVSAIEYKKTYDSKWNEYEIEILVFEDGTRLGSGWAIHATPEEIAAGHRIDTNTGVTVITPSGASKVKGGMTAFVDMGDDSHIENHVSPNCKKFDERVK